MIINAEYMFKQNCKMDYGYSFRAILPVSDKIIRCATRTVELPSTQNPGNVESKLLFMIAIGLVPNSSKYLYFIILINFCRVLVLLIVLVQLPAYQNLFVRPSVTCSRLLANIGANCRT